MDDINRMKDCLAEQQKTNHWLAQQLGKGDNTVSRWCTNTPQSDLVTLKRIALLLDVDICDLINHTK